MDSSHLTLKVLVLFTCTFYRCHAHQAEHVSDTTTSYKYQVFRIYARTESDLDHVRQLRDKYDLDPWRDIHRVNQSGDFLVKPGHIDDVTGILSENWIEHEINIPDAESFLQDMTQSQRYRHRDRRDTSSHKYRHKYLSYAELMRFLMNVNLTSDAQIQLGSIGKSFEGRETLFIKIGSNNSWPGKRTILIDAGVHSREWISPAMAVEIINRLAINSEKDYAVNILLELFNWVIVPLVNPDGYARTFLKGIGNRLWRKNTNRLYSTDPYCYGVDLNRNFGYQWNNSPLHGGSSNPCSGTFSGPRSFSEPETLNMRRMLLSNRDRIAGYISFHSFGQYFLYPWGYSSDVDLEDETDLHYVASAFVDTMKRKDYVYNLGASAKTLYPASGGSDDYVRGVVGVKYAYTVELPPHETSRYGFLLPESDVMSVVSDTWDGLKSFAFRLHQYMRLPPTHIHQDSRWNNLGSEIRKVRLNWERNDFSDGRNIEKQAGYRITKENPASSPGNSTSKQSRFDAQIIQSIKRRNRRRQLHVRSKIN
ncbi:hypothetical protein Btru_060936 [Bulinus truncatus]|nr:hypothetical protein Btru_060936 [Bulinus truncatus]